jgi:hypothetical protein
MPALDLQLEGDNCWPDLQAKLVETTQDISLALLPGGMSSGKAAVTIRLNLPGERVVLGETSLDLFVAAARAFIGRMDYLADQEARLTPKKPEERH